MVIVCDGYCVWWLLCVMVIVCDGYYVWWILCVMVIMCDGYYVWWLLYVMVNMCDGYNVWWLLYVMVIVCDCCYVWWLLCVMVIMCDGYYVWWLLCVMVIMFSYLRVYSKFLGELVKHRNPEVLLAEKDTRSSFMIHHKQLQKKDLRMLDTTVCEQRPSQKNKGIIDSNNILKHSKVY